MKLLNNGHNSSGRVAAQNPRNNTPRRCDQGGLAFVQGKDEKPEEKIKKPIKKETHTDMSVLRMTIVPTNAQVSQRNSVGNDC